MNRKCQHVLKANEFVLMNLGVKMCQMMQYLWRIRGKINT